MFVVFIVALIVAIAASYAMFIASYDRSSGLPEPDCKKNFIISFVPCGYCWYCVSRKFNSFDS